MPPVDMTQVTAADLGYMARALALAREGLFTTTPNPRVGCVIVKQNAVIGEGYHRCAGEPHAEANALADARAHGHDLRGATLYVTLEPCNHHGRTPPCVDAILAHGIGRVVAAMRDPNPKQAHGAQRLAAAGVAVLFGVHESEARELNIGFVSRMTRGRPWVRAKLAASLDGRTALQNGASQWITGALARADGHAWRARACAILTGVGTVLQDDPLLSVRDVATPRQPLRVIVDRHGQTPASARILQDGPTLIVTAGEHNPAWPAATEVVALPDPQRRVDLPALLTSLAGRGVNELHVEAGAKLTGALLEMGLIDELLLYCAPLLIGDPARGMFERVAALASLPSATRVAFHHVERIGDDLRIVARVLAGKD